MAGETHWHRWRWWRRWLSLNVFFLVFSFFFASRRKREQLHTSNERNRYNLSGDGKKSRLQCYTTYAHVKYMCNVFEKFHLSLFLRSKAHTTVCATFHSVNWKLTLKNVWKLQRNYERTLNNIKVIGSMTVKTMLIVMLCSSRTRHPHIHTSVMFIY